MHSELKECSDVRGAIPGRVARPRWWIRGHASGGGGTGCTSGRRRHGLRLGVATAPGGPTDVVITKGRMTAALHELRGVLIGLSITAI